MKLDSLEHVVNLVFLVHLEQQVVPEVQDQEANRVHQDQVANRDQVDKGEILF